MDIIDENDASRHPINTHNYAVDTPPIKIFFQTVCEWIDNRIPGGYIYGPSRFGKTRAVKYWIDDLIREHYHGKVPFFRVICARRMRPSEREFLQAVLKGLKLKFRSSKSIFVMTERISNYLCASARAKKVNYVVLMVDEAQEMSEVEFGVLCNIQNFMEDAGFQLTVIAVGSHELAYQHEAFLLGEDMHLIGRFMVHNAAFYGIQSVDELRFTLAGYDLYTEWPEGSGLSFTKFFFPQAFSAGFRIENWADFMWQCFLDLAPLSLQSRLQVPMQNIGKAVEHIFRSLAVNDGVDFDLTEEDIRTAIRNTRYVEHMQTLALIGRRRSVV